MTEIEKKAKQVLDELRSKAEKFGEDSAEFKEFQAKTEKVFDETEKKNQELVKQMAEEVKKNDALKERMESLELEIVTKSQASDVDYKTMPEYKAFEQVIRHGLDGVSDEERKTFLDYHREQKTLRSDDQTRGGYLVVNEQDNQIIKQITEISNVRQIARVKTVSKKTLDIPTRTGIPSATYEGEAEAGNDTNSTYGAEQVTTYRLTNTIPFTQDQMMDSSFDLMSEINMDNGEAFAQAEGRGFVNGTGFKQPEGFLQHAALSTAFNASTNLVGYRETENVGAITGDDLLLMTGDLKVGYNPMFVFNRQTLAKLRTLKGTDGHYLWQENLAPGAPNTIAGEPYMVLQDMPSIAANSFSVAYGDFMRGYCITDRTGTLMIMDEYSQKRKAIIELTFHRWNTGQVILPEAIKLLRTKA